MDGPFRRNHGSAPVIPCAITATRRGSPPRRGVLAVPESRCGEMVLEAVKEPDKPQDSRNAA